MAGHVASRQVDNKNGMGRPHRRQTSKPLMTRVSAAKEEQHAVLFVQVFIMAAICVGLGQVAKEGLWVWRKKRWGQVVKPLTSCKPFVL